MTTDNKPKCIPINSKTEVEMQHIDSKVREIDVIHHSLGPLVFKKDYDQLRTISDAHAADAMCARGERDAAREECAKLRQENERLKAKVKDAVATEELMIADKAKIYWKWCDAEQALAKLCITTESYRAMLAKAVQFLCEAKVKFAPHTTNSFVDDFLKEAKAALEVKE